MNKVKNIAVSTGNVIKKYSPQILITVGTLSGAAGLITACKQTLTVNEVIEKEVEILERINSCEEEDYTDEQKAKDKKKAYLSMVKKLSKHYALPIALETVCVASVFGCYAVLNRDKKELSALAISYANAYASYRERVREKYGAEVDAELMSSGKVVVSDPTTGEVSEPMDITSPEQLVFFGTECSAYVNDAEYNYSTLKTMQSMAQDKLDTTGRLSVYDVKEMLGAHRLVSNATYINECCTGWMAGDIVDFGLDSCEPSVKAFRDGIVSEVWIRLNPTGPIKNIEE